MSSLAKGCVHFREAQNVGSILQSYKIVYRYLVKQIHQKEARDIKIKTCLCQICRSSAPHLMACLSCVSVGCLMPDNHIHSHFKKTQHKFAVELNYGNVYCMDCGDFIYHVDLDKVAMDVDHQLKITHKPNGTTRYLVWEPTITELEFLRDNPKRRKLDSNSSTGLRGLYNLGSTCFMNCILQALTHTPVLRDYFLSDQHRCDSEHKQSQCVVCAMNILYQEFYGGKTSPYIPFRILFLIWINARNLAGYEQQDAHEFFISSLDVLHRQSTGETTPSIPPEQIGSPGSEAPCNCIIDRIFGGKLQSDVICQTCDGISTTIDPFRDISLDLATHQRSPPKPFHGKSMPYNFSVPSNLLECLEKFTRQENLGEEKIYCGKCYSRQESSKRLLLYQLPLVFCFHLKRFEHSQHSRKISQFISFPIELDLTPFVAEKAKTTGKDNRYSLFAVVNHSGSIHNGHYTCFIRQQDDQWFKCDDEWITRAHSEDVLHSEGYLLFYHKKVLDMD